MQRGLLVLEGGDAIRQGFELALVVEGQLARPARRLGLCAAALVGRRRRALDAVARGPLLGTLGLHMQLGNDDFRLRPCGACCEIRCIFFNIFNYIFT